MACIRTGRGRFEQKPQIERGYIVEYNLSDARQTTGSATNLLSRLHFRKYRHKQLHGIGMAGMQGLQTYEYQLQQEMQKLSWINCEQNDLETICINNLPAFGQLDCYRCKKLKYLDVSNNPSFGVLHCVGCKNLETINFRNTNLKELSCGGCNLSEIDVTGMPNLKNLWCGDNNLSTLDVSNCPQLETLSCEGNNISVLYMAVGQEIPNLYKDETTRIVYK